MANKMIKIKFFNSILEAQLAGNLLKEHGIQNWVQKRGMEFPGDLGDSYGAELSVMEKDIKNAKEILEIEKEEEKR
jgi:hypothetical protein